MIIDTHAHLNFNSFKDDWNELINKSLDNNIWMINVGSQYTTSRRAVEIANHYEKGVWAALGLHPLQLETGLVKIKTDKEEAEFPTREEKLDYQKYKELAKSPKVVAIGEIGLDYYWKPKTKKRLLAFKDKQKAVLYEQLKLASELNLPVIFHCRVAHQDLIDFLTLIINKKELKIKGVMHGFVGTVEQLDKYLEMGFYIGFNGIIFKKIEGINFEENIKKTPLDKILLETDCPYLTPPDFPEERNNPLGVKFVAEQVAKIKKINPEEIAEITTKNAKTLFKLKF
jgi:TatD DNase family protein